MICLDATHDILNHDGLCPDFYFLPGAGGLQRLNDETSIKLRNTTAHDQTLGREDARSARQWALGILQHL